MIARFPDVVRDIDWDFMRWFVREDREAGTAAGEDRLVALARLGYGGDAPFADYIAADAVEILMRRGDTAGASGLLQYIDEPIAVENMLAQKRYASLWPRLEQLAGPHLERVRASSVAGAERAFAEAATDPGALQRYANALRHAGRLDDAIALGAKLPQSDKDMAAADEQVGWAVNNVALALHEAGRAEDADRLFARLNDAPMPKEYWRVSMKINRLELLVLDGKFDRALALVEPAASAEGSPYAAQLVRRLRYCTLSSLGRKAEAVKHLPDLLGHASDAPAPTIDGLLCAGELDKAEQVALAALKTADARKRSAFEEDFVRQLQKRPLTSDDPSVWQARWQELRTRPVIAREFDRLGRDMPEEFLPPARNAPPTK